MNKKNINTIIAAAISIGSIGSVMVQAEECVVVNQSEMSSVKSKSAGKGQVINVKNTLHIRKSASTSATVVGKVPVKATFEIMAKSGTWYKIKYGSVVGYVSGDYVKVISMPTTDNNSGNSSGSNTTTASGKGQVINVKNTLNIRKSTSTSATVVGKIPVNATFEIIAKSGTWYKIKYGTVVGYVSGDYVKVISMPTTDNNSGNSSNGNSTTTSGKGQVINVKNTLNIRKSASTSATVVGKIPVNATFEIIAKSGTWYKIKYGTVVGYVSGDYVKVISMPTTDNNGGSNNSGNSSGGNTTTSGGKGQVINVKNTLNIRKSASTSATVVGKIPANATFEIIAKSGTWYKIKYGTVVGYVSGDYVKVISMPITDSNTGSNNSDNSFEDGSSNNGNVNVEIPVSKYGMVVNISTSSNLRVRKEPNTTSTVLGYLNAAQKVQIVAETGDWYKIMFNNTTGYVSASYIEIISYNPNDPQDSETRAKFEMILNKMKSQLGSPYVYGGVGEIITESLIEDLQKKYPGQSYVVSEEYYDKEWRAFDCSGLMQWGFKVAGVYLSRNTAGQITNGIEVGLDNLQPGDLIFYKTLNHVGMYVGDGMWIESPRTGLQVRIVNVPWNLVGRARRVL